MTETEKPEQCQACQFETVELEDYGQAAGGREPLPKDMRRPHKWLCLLCASTSAGAALDYPQLYSGEIQSVLQAVSFVGNTVLKALKDSRPASLGETPEGT